MMKYEAFRVDETNIDGFKVIKGFFVRGQRCTDLNWSLLYEAKTYDEAVAKAFELRETEAAGAWCPVLDPQGYEIRQ